MPIRDPNIELQSLYMLWDDLSSGKVMSYTIGDRTITLSNMEILLHRIRVAELAVAVATGRSVYADLSWPAHQPPFPDG